MAKKKNTKNKAKQVASIVEEKVLPQNILPFGERVEENKNIYILQKTYKEVYIHPELLRYMQAICMATRKRKEIRVGVSVRGSLTLMRAAQAYACIQGRNYVVPEDVKKLVVPVLAHRLVMEGNYYLQNAALAQLEQILKEIPVPTEEWEKA